MNNNQQGVISNVSEKPWTDNKTGADIKLYSFQLEGNNRWFRTGETPLPYGRGQAVQFVANGQNVDVKTMVAVQGEPVRAPAPAASRSATTAGRGTHTSAKDDYWAAKEEYYRTVEVPRITRASAVSSAAVIVDSALKNDALSFGTVAKSKRIPMLAEFVLELADQIVLYISDGAYVTTEANEGDE